MERFAGETINLLTFMGTRGYANEIGAMSAEERRAVGENGYDNGIGAMSAKHRRNSFGNWCLLSYAVKVINK
jgi:hypothetical protein